MGDRIRKGFKFPIGRGQLFRALLDSLFQLIVGPLQSRVALLNLRQHAVEVIDQDREFVAIAGAFGADRIVLVAGDDSCDPCQVNDRFSDGSTENR